MNVVVLGGTKGMGRAVARGLAARGDRVHLLGRDLADLRRTADDLGVRAGAPGTVTFSECNLAAPETFDSALDAADSTLGTIQAVVVSAGVFATQDVLEQDQALTSQVLTVDFVNTVLFCELARKRLLASGGGTLCVFSSVAGERGRKPVVLYGAAKAGLSRYLEGLDHRFRDRGLRTVCVKPGFVKTSMTAGLTPPPFAVDAEAVVAPVLRAIDNGTPVVYVPGIWRFVMLVIRALPRAVMRRLSF